MVGIAGGVGDIVQPVGDLQVEVVLLAGFHVGRNVGLPAGKVFAGCGGSSNGGSSNEAQSTGSEEGAKAGQARTLDEIKDSGKIKIGVFSDKNPFGYVDENGEIQGYDVYFAKRIAKDLLGSEDAVEFVRDT